MKTLEEIITETFEFIPDHIFTNKNTEKSIYINLEKMAYKHDWAGKVFTNGAGKIIKHFEINQQKIKATKAKTLDCLVSERNKEKENLIAFAIQRQQTNNL